MNPNQIVLNINCTLFIASGLFFSLVLGRPELIPLFSGFQSAFNLLGFVGFYVDKKREIMMAFFWGLLLMTVVTLAGFVLINHFQYLVGVDET